MSRRRNRTYDDYDRYGDGYDDAPQADYSYAEQGFVPANRADSRQGGRRGSLGNGNSYGDGSYGTQHVEPAVPSDHRGRITSFFSLLLALAIVVLSVGGCVVPVMMGAGNGGTELVDLAIATVMGYGAILASFVLGMPTVLIALRSAATAKGHVGRGRSLVSIVLAVTVPVLSLAVLSTFVVRKAQTIDWDEVIPKVETDEDGKTRITGGKALGSDMGDIINQINEMAEEGYSVGFDGNGNLVATDPNGQTVTITPEDLAQIGSTSQEQAQDVAQEVQEPVEQEPAAQEPVAQEPAGDATE